MIPLAEKPASKTIVGAMQAVAKCLADHKSTAQHLCAGLGRHRKHLQCLEGSVELNRYDGKLVPKARIPGDFRLEAHRYFELHFAHRGWRLTETDGNPEFTPEKFTDFFSPYPTDGWADLSRVKFTSVSEKLGSGAQRNELAAETEATSALISLKKLYSKERAEAVPEKRVQGTDVLATKLSDTRLAAKARMREQFRRQAEAREGQYTLDQPSEPEEGAFLLQ